MLLQQIIYWKSLVQLSQLKFSFHTKMINYGFHCVTSKGCWQLKTWSNLTLGGHVIGVCTEYSQQVEGDFTTRHPYWIIDRKSVHTEHQNCSVSLCFGKFVNYIGLSVPYYLTNHITITIATYSHFPAKFTKKMAVIYLYYFIYCKTKRRLKKK